jgi:hypothetical protein
MTRGRKGEREEVIEKGRKPHGAGAAGSLTGEDVVLRAAVGSAARVTDIRKRRKQRQNNTKTGAHEEKKTGQAKGQAQQSIEIKHGRQLIRDQAQESATTHR